MKNALSLPLAMDLGASRVRIGYARACGDTMYVEAIAGRDLPDDGTNDPSLIAAVIEDALAELAVRERRVVVALTQTVAHVRAVQFPPMSYPERARAAAFEIRRSIPWDVESEATRVRVHPIDRERGAYAIGAARAEVIQRMGGLVKSCGLRLAGIDHESVALRRALADYDAVIDVGLERSGLHVFADAVPQSWTVPAGGAEVTRSIARELRLDEPLAEKRKRILGAAGAGNDARSALAAQLAASIERARARAPISYVALTGNGARLGGLAQNLAATAAVRVELPVSPTLRNGSYSDDLLRSAAPDWGVTAGLLSWALAA